MHTYTAAQKFGISRIFIVLSSTTVSTLIINQHIIMISEDHVTEDWSNDAENTALITEINYILNYIKIENRYFKLQ